MTQNVVLLHVGSAQELKDHPYFEGIDWQQVYLQKYPPPLIPPRGEVNAADAFDIGSFDEEDTKGIKVRCRQILCCVNVVPVWRRSRDLTTSSTYFFGSASLNIAFNVFILKLFCI